MTYHLRRLRLHGLIEREKGSHRYRVTDKGLRVALFFTRSYERWLQPALAELTEPPLAENTKLQEALAKFDRAVDAYAAQTKC